MYYITACWISSFSFFLSFSISLLLYLSLSLYYFKFFFEKYTVPLFVVLWVYLSLYLFVLETYFVFDCYFLSISLYIFSSVLLKMQCLYMFPSDSISLNLFLSSLRYIFYTCTSIFLFFWSFPWVFLDVFSVVACCLLFPSLFHLQFIFLTYIYNFYYCCM